MNPIICADFPEPDVIRVGDTYYMICATMHFFPGGTLLKSYDLVHWEIAAHVFERLDDTPAEQLEGEQSIYGKGMWAASLRYHKDTFYVCFASYDTGKTYIYRTKLLMNHGKNAASMGSIITHLCYLMKMGASIWDTVLMKCGY